MRHVPFYEEYLHKVLVPKLSEVAQKYGADLTSVAKFHTKFQEYFQLKVSYDVFRRWMKDSGTTLRRQATIQVGGAGAEEPAAPPPPPIQKQHEDFPMPPEPPKQEGMGNYQPMRPGPQQPANPQRPMFNRGGILD